MKIGKRILKTALAVAMCLLVYLGLMGLDLALGMNRDVDTFAPTNWYTPFFAGIATVYAMQNNQKGSVSQARIRSFGSIIGGTFGAIIIFIFEFIYLKVSNTASLDEVKNTLLFETLEFVVTSLGILLVIPLTVKLKWSQATFISCLTYLSVTISIRNGGMNVFFFAFNRIFSTIIGVLISLYINTFPHFVPKNKDILFISSLDNAILNDDMSLSPYSHFKLNQLMDSDCSLSFMTTRVLTQAGRIFKGVNLQKPIVVMNGVAIYNPKTEKYYDNIVLSQKDRAKIETIFKEFDIDFFTYLFNHEVLSSYFNKLTNEGSIRYFNDRKDVSRYSFVEALTPKHLFVSQYVVIDKDEVVEKLEKALDECDFNNSITIVTYPYEKVPGYSFLKINASSTSKELAIEKLKEEKHKYLVVVGSGRTDIESMKKADFSLCLNNAPSYVKEVADYIIDSDKHEEILNFVFTVYHKRNYKEYLDSLRKK